MTTTPSEHDNNFAAGPSGDDALQDYMSSLFPVAAAIDAESPAAEDLGDKVLGAEDLAGADASEEVPREEVPVPAVSAEIAGERSDTPPRKFASVEVQHEEWENRISPYEVTNTTAKASELSAKRPSFESKPAPQAKVTQRLMAEQVPTDIPLSEEQKKGLQKLLDQKLLIAPEAFAEPQSPPEIMAGEEGLDVVDYSPARADTQLLEPEVVEELIGEEPLPAVELLDENIDGSQPEPQRVHNYREHWNNQLPDWGQSKFDALLFSSRGVTLAIPLIALGHIYLQTKPLNQLPSLPSWVIGVKPLTHGQLKIIDAGAFFMPERPNRLNTDADLHLLALADSQWAFAVDSVANPISISVGDVQWRPLSDANPWLAGAIKHHMCVLIDTPALLKLLGR